MQRWRGRVGRSAIAGALLVALVGLTACGGDGGDDATPPRAAPRTTSTDAPVAGTGTSTSTSAAPTGGGAPSTTEGRVAAGPSATGGEDASAFGQPLAVGRRACAADGKVTATGTPLQQPVAHDGSVTVSAIGGNAQRVTVRAGRLDATDAAGIELVQDLVFDDAGATLRSASVRAVAFGQHEDQSASASRPERVSDRIWSAGASHTAHLTGKGTTMAVTLSAVRVEPTPTARVAGAMRFVAEIWMAGAARAHMHLDLWLDPVTRLIREVQGTAHIDEALAAADLSFRSVC